MTYITQTYQTADAFLFGRRTYQMFAPNGTEWIRAAIRSQTP
jgi:hypothetical protein